MWMAPIQGNAHDNTIYFSQTSSLLFGMHTLHFLTLIGNKVQCVLLLPGSAQRRWGGPFLFSSLGVRGIVSFYSPLYAFTAHVQDRMAKRIQAQRLEGVDENIW